MQLSQKKRNIFPIFILLFGNLNSISKIFQKMMTLIADV